MADMARRIQAATKTAKVKLWSSKLTGGKWLIWLGESRLPPGQQRRNCRVENLQKVYG
jgi:hypothetical protein